jgi:hypothetical protein
MAMGEANGGLFTADGAGYGIFCRQSGSGTALQSEVWGYGTGYAGYFSGGSGLHVTAYDTYPLLSSANLRTTGDGDAGWFTAEPGVSSSTWTLYSRCYDGQAGRFSKYTDDSEYAVKIYGANSTANGLYVSGTIYTTSPMARGVETSKGTEAVFGVASPDVRLMLSGSASLTDGRARVDFDRTFAESVRDPSDLVVTVTSIGSWSATFVEQIDADGFTVRSEAGDMSAEFHWVAVGKTATQRPSVVIPDPDEDLRLEEKKVREAEARRPPVSDDTDPVRIIRW